MPGNDQCLACELAQRWAGMRVGECLQQPHPRLVGLCTRFADLAETVIGTWRQAWLCACGDQLVLGFIEPAQACVSDAHVEVQQGVIAV